MKRIFTFFTALVLTGVVAVQAQNVWQKGWVDAQAPNVCAAVLPQPSPSSHAAKKATIEPAENQNWWGFVSTSSTKYGLGVGDTDTYHCAVFIPGTHIVAGGKTIHAVRFGLVAPNASDAKVWIASQLPSDINETSCIDVVEVNADELKSDCIDVNLSAPYTIPEEGVYVGYSFTINKVQFSSDAYPALFTGEEFNNSFYIRTKTKQKSWISMYGNGYGSLFLQVLLEGTFEDNIAAVVPLNIGKYYTKLGEQAMVNLTLANLGTSPITSIDYQIGNANSEELSEQQHMDLETPIPFVSSELISLPVDPQPEIGSKQMTLHVTKVNGEENKLVYSDPHYNYTNFNLYTLSDIIERNVVVEEYTGTGCGWCPRGLIGMDKLRKTFGDRFIGIGLHQYNSGDAMFIAKNAYANVKFNGAPSCRMNRNDEIDPYYGVGTDICDDFRAEMAIPALVAVTVSGMWNEEKTEVEAKATVSPLFDSSFKLEFVLVGDGLTGTGSAWTQSNYYYQYSSSELPDDLAIFGSDGKYGSSTISGWKFNDVALSSSYTGGQNQVAALEDLQAGTPVDIDFTLKLPTKATLLNAIKKDKVYVVALVISPDGTIANATKAKVEDYDPTGISTAAATMQQSTVAVSYSLTGRRLTAPQKGLNIVRTADGQIRKTIVR